MCGSRVFMLSMISLMFSRVNSGWLGRILWRMRELRCFLLGFAPRATSRAEVAFSAALALRKAVRG